MNPTTNQTYDLRQSEEWADFLHRIGWKIEKIENTFVFIRPIPFIKRALIKIQRNTETVSLEAVDELAKKNRVISVSIEPIQNFVEMDFENYRYLKSKMVLAPSATSRIELAEPENMMTHFSENARRNIKKAYTQELSIERRFFSGEKTISVFKDFRTLYEHVATMKKFYVPPYTEDLEKALALSKLSMFLFAYHNGTPVGVLWLVRYQNTLYYMHVGINEKGYALSANYLLVWEAMKYAREIGCTIFDFESMYDYRYPALGKRWKGFSEFKMRFHPTMVYYPEPYIKFYNPLLYGMYLCGNLFSK